MGFDFPEQRAQELYKPKAVDFLSWKTPENRPCAWNFHTTPVTVEPGVGKVYYPGIDSGPGFLLPRPFSGSNHSVTSRFTRWVDHLVEL